jgi:hypothetical protein
MGFDDTHLQKYLIMTMKIIDREILQDCMYIFKPFGIHADGSVEGVLHGIELDARLYMNIGFELLSHVEDVDVDTLIDHPLDALDHYKIKTWACYISKLFEPIDAPLLINWYWLSQSFKREVFGE